MKELACCISNKPRKPLLLLLEFTLEILHLLTVSLPESFTFPLIFTDSLELAVLLYPDELTEKKLTYQQILYGQPPLGRP